MKCSGPEEVSVPTKAHLQTEQPVFKLPPCFCFLYIILLGFILCLFLQIHLYLVLQPNSLHQHCSPHFPLIILPLADKIFFPPQLQKVLFLLPPSCLEGTLDGLSYQPYRSQTAPLGKPHTPCPKWVSQIHLANAVQLTCH